jgi:hypothetical protein
VWVVVVVVCVRVCAFRQSVSWNREGIGSFEDMFRGSLALNMS